MNQTAFELVRLLTEKHKTVAAAESCTGGMISQLITSVSGASNVFSLGICAYSAEQKCRMLGVKQSTIEEFGIVSRETAEEMALGVREKSNTDLAVSTTGFAGPQTGDGLKVGTVCIGFAYENGVYSEMNIFDGGREQVRVQAAWRALRIIIDYINGELKL